LRTIESFLAINAEKPLVVHDKAFPAQENEPAPVAKAPAFPGARQKAFAQLWIVRPPGASAHRPPAVTLHARRSLISCASLRCATASRLTAGVTIFCQEVLQRRVVRHGIGQPPLQLAVLALKLLQALGFPLMMGAA
jgi:hypothetical protein